MFIFFSRETREKGPARSSDHPTHPDQAHHWLRQTNLNSDRQQIFGHKVSVSAEADGRRQHIPIQQEHICRQNSLHHEDQHKLSLDL